MKLIDVQVIEKNQSVISALMATCEQCNQSSFRILVVHGHNHLECITCGTSYCQGDCDRGCKDDSCDQSHCAKCGCHMMGGYLPLGTVCDSCKMEEEESDSACSYCGGGLLNEKGDCQKCGM